MYVRYVKLIDFNEELPHLVRDYIIKTYPGKLFTIIYGSQDKQFKVKLREYTERYGKNGMERDYTGITYIVSKEDIMNGPGEILDFARLDPIRQNLIPKRT